MPLINNQSRKTTVITTLKVVVVMLIVYMIYRTVDKTGGEFTSRDLSLSNFSYLWLVASAFCYALGLSCFACFWHGALRLLQQTPRLSESLGSYFISHLGKYVPGKALVVVIKVNEQTHVPLYLQQQLESLKAMAVKRRNWINPCVQSSDLQTQPFSGSALAWHLRPASLPPPLFVKQLIRR